MLLIDGFNCISIYPKEFLVILYATIMLFHTNYGNKVFKMPLCVYAFKFNNI